MESWMVDFIIVSLSLFSLLIISSFMYLLAKKINVPYTILLFVVWLALVPLSDIEIFWWISSFKLTPEVLFFVFLPILVFESAYNIKYKELLKNWKTIFSLAVIWLLFSTFSIWFLLYFIFWLMGWNIPFWVTLLFWALISSTDPVAVLSLFKSVWAPRRLSLIFEWESLFNDGTSFAVFLIIISILSEISLWNSFNLTSSFIEWFFTFLSMFIWWIVFGLVIWFLFSKVLWKIKNVDKVEMTLTMVLAHITFLLAEWITHFTPLAISWIISTAIAGVVAWNYWRHKISPKIEEYMDHFWEYFAWIANSLVFILMGLVLADVDANFLMFLPLILVTIIVVIIIRWISVYLPLSILSYFKIEEPIPKNWQHLLAWWSLRWALALMMVLMIPEHLTLPWWDLSFSIKDFLTVLVVGSVMFTLIVKALTIMPLIKKLNINKINSLEQFEYYEWIIIALLKMLAKLDENYSSSYIVKEEYDELKFKYQKKLNDAILGMKKLLNEEKSSQELIEKAISLHALGIEKQYLKNLFISNEIDENNYRILLWKIERQKDRIEGWLSQFKNGDDFRFDNKNIFEKFAEKSLNKQNPSNRYVRNRARSIIIKNTITELEQLSCVNFYFDKKYFHKIIDMYKKLLKIANDKNDNLLKNYKTTIMSLETKLSERTLLRIEEWVISDLFNKEIITPKLYHKFMEEIESWVYEKY